MQTINRDLERLTMDQSRGKSFHSFLDVLGADVDSSFGQTITTEVLNNTYSLSGAGREVKHNEQIQIQLDMSPALLMLDRCFIIGEVTVTNGHIDNALSLFDCQQWDIGSVSNSFAFQKHLCQQKLAKTDNDTIAKYSRGLLLNRDIAMISIDDGSVFVGEANDRTPLNAYVIHNRTTALMNKEGGAIRFAVPFTMLADSLGQIPDKCVFLGLGQRFKLNLRTTSGPECVVSDAAGEPSFAINNMALALTYARLDPPREELVLKSRIEIPFVKHNSFIVNSCTPVINTVFPVSKGERIRALWLSFPSAVQGADSNAGSNVVANYVNGTAAQFKAPLTYHPQLPIQRIDLQVGGQVITINQSMLQSLHVQCFSGLQDAYTHPIMRALKSVIVIDLSRFGICVDDYGSTGKGITSIQCQITLQVGVKSLPYQAANWDAAAYAHLSCASFLETQQMFECVNGIYRTA